MARGDGREERHDHRARIELRRHAALCLAAARGWRPGVRHRVRGRGGRPHGHRPGAALMAPLAGRREGMMYGADFYDRIHIQANRPETLALYRPLFQKVARAVRVLGSRSILEVGCGNGFLASILLREYDGAYRGFDFSPVAIRNAGDRTGRPELFSRADAL